MNPTEWSITTVLIFLLLPLYCCIASDAITPNQPIRDGDVLVSTQKKFALGFFSPGNSSKRYVGVWYNNVPNRTVVWVANRDDPVNDTSGLLAVQGNGGLVIYGKDRSTPLWSASVTLSSPNNSIAKLFDTGNLVLLENESEKVLWQGFDYPSNTLLPYMKLGLNRRSGLNRLLTTWKSQDDPGTGNCSFGINPSGFPQMILYQDGAPRWRTVIGTWAGQRWGGVVSFINNQDEVSIMYVPANDSALSRTMLAESGVLERSSWNDRVHEWNMYWSAPVERCDEYGQCGPNGNCNPYVVNDIDCTCLPGFEPKSPTDWYLRDGTGGCLRRKGVLSMCGNGEGFVKVERVKIPDSSKASFDMNLDLKACEQECLRNCSCMAYSSSDEGSGCVTWQGDLMDIRTLPDAGQNLYVRVDAIVLAQYAKKPNYSLSNKGKVAISLVSVLLLFLVFSLVVWWIRRKRKGKRRQNAHLFGQSTGSAYLGHSSRKIDVDETIMNSDLPFFDLTTIAAATNNFSVENKLGTGGFGSVYKGVLSNGNEIAVKRLSKNSGQGTEEFKNEVMLIAKLQHRNLVRILGCCVQDEEKMLIYEYLPNKSLDFFIFNESHRADLNWTRRFEIICGITRGILYLHQDSRLRIIHRDLKASNVLLDASMNPKIADFGMARIFRGDQSEANTNRVVGTYGYMSPEYAMRGRFSVKSDVYSFGVLLLEIITGRKNRVYYHEESPDSNLVEHVWNLWREGNALEVVDSSLGELYPINEVLRCIQIALLCVQESATDRPTMSVVLAMLGNDATLPSPRQPAFLLQRSGDSSTADGANSVNNVTCTAVEARPGNSSKRYVGVWYNQVPNKTIVWVANRDDPVNDTSGLLAIHGNGGLVIYGNDRSIPLWSANITLSSPNTSIAKLLDTGNLVLLENGDSQKVLWQGFDYSTNTMLSSMKLGLNRRSGLNRSLTTWKSQNDPRIGNCSFWVDPAGLPQLILYKDGAPRWRTDIGSWTGQRWSAVTTFVNNEDEVSVESSTTTNQSTLLRTVVDESGILQRFMWDDRLNEWTMYWSSPIEHCDFYGQCGPNGNCDPYNDDPTLVTVGCSCLPGYEPKSRTDWYMRDGSGGCVKEIGVSMCRSGEGFVKVENVKLPDSSKARVDMSLSLNACEQECLRDCSCTSYSSANESSKVVGCVTWYGDLMDTSTYADTGQDLYVRVDAIVLAQYAKKSNASLDKKGKLAISLSSGLALVVLVTLLYWLLRRQRKAKQKQKKYIFRVTVEDPTADLNDGSNMNSDLPFFDLRTIAAITNNFSGTNKLGNGGFGSVYKGILCNGTEIAVKRLSKHSGQGIEQFKNEVGLISKLQHRNLVRILGYCVEEEEKMIIYEYVPNRSLDFFIFDETKRALLDWTKRFDIICGIARGILYLHQDSRLRIIHRDLKASNILLDGSMIPKIADFGMARIFRGDQSEASTTRVVGTYGYMSPEYAMEGLFSVKSDVYSFGVLLLEIITGRRNAGYYHEKYPDLNLIGHVWELWREGIALEIVDSCLDKSCHLHGVLRCIQIALLCVQEFAMDRPTMSTVVFMLVNDTTLSSPRPPAFLVKRAYSNGHSSVNDVTCSMVEAR